MPSLAEVQTKLRDALVDNRVENAAPLLVGGRDPAKRLAVHQRHYEASLTSALVGKFPATAWLIGATAIAEAARAFVHQCPPAAPCIAEYGAQFPRYLAGRADTQALPYLRSFAELEWQLGHAAIAVDLPPRGMDAFGSIAAAALPDIRLVLQPSLGYCPAAWPIDALIKLYLNETAPAQSAFEPFDVYLEIRGARGEFRITRLDPATFAFRNALLERAPIGAAAEAALDRDPVFDPGRALTGLVADGLVIALRQTTEERQHDCRRSAAG